MAPGTADKKNNVLPLWGNEKTMNLNNLILTNILSSHYFKVNLYQLKTYHEVIDEIYYHVNHLEPWEKGSRKTSGQTGMCGGVRGVGAGGIVSTAFCILYKLFTLKLTRKQVNGLITHCDSPYIRALGFMYVRFTQPPAHLWDWFDPYLDDKEELDVKAGGGQIMTIGEILRHFLTKLEWFSTLFPRIPVPIQKDIERKLSERKPSLKTSLVAAGMEHDELAGGEDGMDANDHGSEKPHGTGHDRNSKLRRSPFREGKVKADDRGSKSASADKSDLAEEIARERERQKRERERASRSRSPQHHHHHHHHHHERRSRSKDRHKHRERSRERRSHHSRDREKERQHKEDHHRERERDRASERKEHYRSRSRSRDRHKSRRHEEHGRSSRDRHHY